MSNREPLTISDALAAKITAHWGDNQAYKDWIKASTREVLKEGRDPRRTRGRQRATACGGRADRSR